MDSEVAPAQEADRVDSDVRAEASEVRAAPGAQADSAARAEDSEVPGIPAARVVAEVRRAEAARDADTDFTNLTSLSGALTQNIYAAAQKPRRFFKRYSRHLNKETI